MEKKFGYISIIGRPNAGKSTLINSIIGEDLSSVSSLPQTTRSCIRGVLNNEQGQIVFVDTPGIHAGKYKINEAMLNATAKTVDNGNYDAVIYLVDISRSTDGEEEEMSAQMATSAIKNLIILFNKIDITPTADAEIEFFYKKHPNLQLVPSFKISANNLTTKDEILAQLFSYLSVGEPHYKDDEYTDSTIRFLSSEIIRNQIILNTTDEIPHASCVNIENWKETEELTEIEAVITVDSAGHRKIMIGENGKRIKQIREFSRRKIAKLIGTKIKLELFVKVLEGWRDNQTFLRESGFEYKKK